MRRSVEQRGRHMNKCLNRREEKKKEGVGQYFSLSFTVRNLESFKRFYCAHKSA